VHESDGTHLAVVGDQDLYLGVLTTVDDRPGRPASDAVTPAGLESGDDRIRTAQQQGCVDLLCARGPSGEQQDHAGQDALPGATVEASSVDGALGESELHELSSGGDAQRERRPDVGVSRKSASHAEMVTARPSARGRFGQPGSGKPLSDPLATAKWLS